MASNGEKVSIWWRHHDSHLASSLVDNNAFKIVRIAVIYCSIYYPIYARRHQFIWPITEYKTQRVPSISAKFCQQLGTTESSNTEPLHRNLTNTSWDSCDILCNQWVIDLCYQVKAKPRLRSVPPWRSEPPWRYAQTRTRYGVPDLTNLHWHTYGVIFKT